MQKTPPGIADIGKTPLLIAVVACALLLANDVPARLAAGFGCSLALLALGAASWQSRTRRLLALGFADDFEATLCARPGSPPYRAQLNEAPGISDASRRADIATQAKLVALDTAIEAARVGDASRNFSLIAEAVRELSSQWLIAGKEMQERVAADKAARLECPIEDRMRETLCAVRADLACLLGRLREETMSSQSTSQAFETATWIAELEKSHARLERFETPPRTAG